MDAGTLTRIAKNLKTVPTKGNLQPSDDIWHHVNREFPHCLKHPPQNHANMQLVN